MSVECPACGERISGDKERLCSECEGVLKEDGHIAYLHKRRKVAEADCNNFQKEN